MAVSQYQTPAIVAGASRKVILVELNPSNHVPASPSDPTALRAPAHVLHITSTIKGHESRTLRLAGIFFAELAKAAPTVKVTTLDLFATPPPLDTPTYAALTRSIGRAPMTPEEQTLVTRWDPWIDKLIVADLLVFTTPLWNFHAPIQLKAFIDIVTQHGKSFKYTHEGPTGVLDGKRAVLIQTRGAWGPDHLGDWLKDCLWLLGGAGLDVVKADKQDLGTPEEKEMELARATEAAQVLARRLAGVLAERHA